MDIILWLLTVETLGLLAFPFAFKLLPTLKDRGYGFAKPLGLLMLSYPVWLLGSAHVPLGPRLTAVLVLAALAVAAAVLARRLWPELLDYVRRRWRLLLAAEAVFLAVFALWSILRAGLSAIGHTEQPMDFAFLNASMIAPSYPPGDPWLAGHGISYYYFGYLTLGLPGVLTGISSAVVYNLALALLPAMASMGVVSLVTTLARRAGATLLTAFALGMLGALMLGFLGNLEGVFELLRAWGLGTEGFWHTVGIKGLDGPAANASFFPTDNWWWWRSSRVIDTVVAGAGLNPTIQEYPFFSWFLGDLHPHVMSVPFVLLFLAFSFNLLAGDSPVGGTWLRRRWHSITAMGLTLGALGFINAWDLPVFFAVGVAVAVLKSCRSVRLGQGGGPLWVAGIAGVLLLLAVVPFLPYYAGSLAGQVKGVAAVTTPGTSPLHFLTVWGVFTAAIAPLALFGLARLGAPLSTGRSLAVAVALGFAPLLLWAAIVLAVGDTGEMADRLWVALPLSVALSAALAAVLRAPPGGEGVALAFTLGAVAVGIALVMGPELFYVVDAFDNRMNTVFKLYYQAWVVLAVAAPLTLYFWVSNAGEGAFWRPRLGAALIVGFAALALSSFYLPIGMALTVNTPASSQYTLDGAAFLRNQAPGEYAAIQWLKTNAKAGDVIVEAVGGDYTAFGRVASFTGLPSVLNWPGHELQWRGSSDLQTGRAEDVAALYQAEDAAAVRAVAERYGVRYVVFGPRERDKYGVATLEHLPSALALAFSHEDVQIFAVLNADA